MFAGSGHTMTTPRGVTLLSNEFSSDMHGGIGGVEVRVSCSTTSIFSTGYGSIWWRVVTIKCHAPVVTLTAHFAHDKTDEMLAWIDARLMELASACAAEAVKVTKDANRLTEWAKQ